jgi:hypothetical protein
MRTFTLSRLGLNRSPGRSQAFTTWICSAISSCVRPTSLASPMAQLTRRHDTWLRNPPARRLRMVSLVAAGAPPSTL